MTNNEKFNQLLNSCKHPRAVYNALSSWADFIAYTNSAIRLRGFFGGSRDFGVFLLAMTNLMLSFWPFSILLLLSMPLCEHYLSFRANTLLPRPRGGRES